MKEKECINSKHAGSKCSHKALRPLIELTMSRAWVIFYTIIRAHAGQGVKERADFCSSDTLTYFGVFWILILVHIENIKSSLINRKFIGLAFTFKILLIMKWVGEVKKNISIHKREDARLLFSESFVILIWKSNVRFERHFDFLLTNDALLPFTKLECCLIRICPSYWKTLISMSMIPFCSLTKASIQWDNYSS